MQEIKKLSVKYNGKIVGTLASLEEGIGFQYDDSWLEDGFSLSPFSLPLSDRIFVCRKDTFGGLFGVFADSLPDGWGELIFRRMLIKKGINPDRLSPLTRLSLVSDRGLGGLNYEPSQAEKSTDDFQNLDRIALESEALWNDKSENVNLDEIYKLGGSSGGARPKVHIKVDGEEWIIKFPCGIDPKDIGHKEFRANQLAAKAGICTNEFKSFSSKRCKGYFGAKRFDRHKDKRIHTVSLSSLLETSHRIPNLDYIHLFQVVQKICFNQDDLYEVFRRMCFNVLYKNRDDHGKNFSFIYDDSKKGYKLSPAYDITQTPKKAEHEMSVNGNGIPSEKELLEVAVKISLSMERCKDILNKIRDVVI